MNKEIKKRSDTGGFVLWARKTFESEIFVQKPAIWFKIWFYIVGNVNWKDSKYFKRGTGFFTYKKIGDATRATRAQIDHCLRWLKSGNARGTSEAHKSATMIATKKATRGIVISVLRYHEYQDFSNTKSDTESDKESDLKAIQKRNKSDTILYTGYTGDTIPPTEVAPDGAPAKPVSGEPTNQMPLSKKPQWTEEDSRVYLEQIMLNDKKAHIRILANYFIAKGFVYENYPMVNAAIKRDTRVAVQLEPYPIEDIVAVMDWCRRTQTDYEWKLETVFKRIDNYRAEKYQAKARKLINNKII